ncbi:MAG: MFS transporter, partial [Geodermatophilaceae bacterium]|nr:MFS transporter [Geodermatophilaceae bacterium]
MAGAPSGSRGPDRPADTTYPRVVPVVPVHTPQRAPAPVGGARAALAGRDFRALLAVRLAGQWADGVFQASLAGAVLFNPEQAATPGDIAAAFVVLLLPYSLVGPFAGVLLDRWSRQRVLLVANLVRAAMVIGVVGLLAGRVAGFPLYAAALAVVSVNRFVLSALPASLPHVVAPGRLISANALTTTAGTVAAVVGGACGVGLAAVLGMDDGGYAGTATVAALGYAVAGSLALRFDVTRLGPDVGTQAARESTRHVFGGMLAGARHIGGRPPVRSALLVIGAHRFLFGLLTVSTLLLYRYYFDGSGFFPSGLPGLAQAVAAGAAGALTAAAVTPAAVRAMGTRRWVVLMFAVAALSQLALMTPYRLPSTLAASAVLGFVGQAVKVCVDTVVQRGVDDDFRGRVFSVYDAMFNGAFVLATVLAAAVLPLSGVSYVVLAAVALGYAACAVA